MKTIHEVIIFVMSVQTVMLQSMEGFISLSSEKTNEVIVYKNKKLELMERLVFLKERLVLVQEQKLALKEREVDIRNARLIIASFEPDNPEVIKQVYQAAGGITWKNGMSRDDAQAAAVLIVAECDRLIDKSKKVKIKERKKKRVTKMRSECYLSNTAKESEMKKDS